MEIIPSHFFFGSVYLLDDNDVIYCWEASSSSFDSFLECNHK